jgi:DNA primase
MDHTTDLTFDPRGLLRHEARLEADLRVTTLPEGLDPDEIVLRDPQEWAKIVEAARPIVVHVMETLAAGQNLDDPKVKSQIAGQVLPLIEDVPNSIEREAYRQRLARLLRVDERSLLGANPPARPVRRRPVGPRSGRPAPQDDGAEQKEPQVSKPQVRREPLLERQCLLLLLRQPEALYRIDRAMQKSGLSRFSAQDFEQIDYQMLAGVILESLEQDYLDAHQFIQEHMPEMLQELVQELLQPYPQGEPTPEGLFEDLIQAVIQLREVRTRAHLNQLIFMTQDVQQQEGENMRLEDYQGIHEVVLQCSQVLKSLNRALLQPIQLD